MSQALTLIDCPLASGRAADLWGVDVSTDTPYRIDLESTSFDAQLVLTGPGVLDPFVGQPIDIDDDLGYAVYEARACGRWYGWIPRCTTRELRWREIEDRWQLVPPDTVRLDPRDL